MPIDWVWYHVIILLRVRLVNAWTLEAFVGTSAFFAHVRLGEILHIPEMTPTAEAF
jgi:hypothetical protein